MNLRNLAVTARLVATRRCALLALLGAGLVACGSSSANSGNADAGPGGDAAVTLVCAGDCSDYVFTRLVLPTTPQLQQQLSVDFDDDGAKDNGLGLIIRAINNLGDLGFQDSVDESVAEGGALLIARLKAPALQDASSAKMQLWLAESQSCCPGAETLEACRLQGESTCFSGSATFQPAQDSPTDMVFSGAITSGALSFGPARLSIPLTLGSPTPTPLTLDNARIFGRIEASGITSGVIAGTLSQQVLDDVVIAALAELIVEESQGDGSGAQTVIGLFDANDDGVVTLTEVAESELVQSIFAADVDADGDGTKELSLGIGFEAVPAQIQLD